MQKNINRRQHRKCCPCFFHASVKIQLPLISSPLYEQVMPEAILHWHLTISRWVKTAHIPHPQSSWISLIIIAMGKSPLLYLYLLTGLQNVPCQSFHLLEKVAGVHTRVHSRGRQATHGHCSHAQFHLKMQIVVVQFVNLFVLGMCPMLVAPYQGYTAATTQC